MFAPAIFPPLWSIFGMITHWTRPVRSLALPIRSWLLSRLSRVSYIRVATLAVIVVDLFQIESPEVANSGSSAATLKLSGSGRTSAG